MGTDAEPQPPAQSTAWTLGMAILALAATGGILAVLYVLYAAQTAREANRRQSLNHMKQIMLALANYEIMYKSLPPHAVYGDDGKPLLSWRVLLVPYLEESDQPGLHREFRLDEPWDSPHNRQLVERMPSVYWNSNLPSGRGVTNYLAVVGEGCAFDGTPTGQKVNRIGDTTPPTVVFVEADVSRAVPWTKPDDLVFDAEGLPTGLGQLRSEGWYAAWTDGSVESVSPEAPESSPASFLINGEPTTAAPQR